MDSQSFLKEDRKKHHCSIMISNFAFVYIIPLGFMALQIFCKDFFMEVSLAFSTHRDVSVTNSEGVRHSGLDRAPHFYVPAAP